MIVSVIALICVHASVIILLSLSFTLTSNTLYASNFSTGAIFVIGEYATITLVRYLDYPGYLGLPTGFIIGALINLILYQYVFKYLLEKNRTQIQVSIASIGVQILLTAFLSIYAYRLREWKSWYTYGGFLVKDSDFVFGPTTGIFLVSSLISFLLFYLVIFLQRRTRFGLSLSMFFEDVELAEIQGINTTQLSAIVWFLAGGLAGLSGAIRPFMFSSIVGDGEWIMTSIIASVLIGGLGDIRGSFFGGVMVGILEIGGTVFIMENFGSWFSVYQHIIPLTLIAVTAYLFPRGLKGKLG